MPVGRRITGDFKQKLFSMRIYEPKNRIDVTTPKGDGIIWIITEFGTETDTIYTIIINTTGEMWQYTHKDIIVKPNITFKRYGNNEKSSS